LLLELQSPFDQPFQFFPRGRDLLGREPIREVGILPQIEKWKEVQRLLVNSKREGRRELRPRVCEGDSQGSRRPSRQTRGGRLRNQPRSSVEAPSLGRSQWWYPS